MCNYWRNQSKGCFNFLPPNGNKLCRQFWVFPATAVPDDDVESMRREARRYATFNNCPLLPPGTWINHLVRGGYYYDDINQTIVCFACAHQHPSHAHDCHRQMENVRFNAVQEPPRVVLASYDIRDIARDANVMLRHSSLTSHHNGNPGCLPEMVDDASSISIRDSASSTSTNYLEDEAPQNPVAASFEENVALETTLNAGVRRQVFSGEQQIQNGVNQSTISISSNQLMFISEHNIINQPTVVDPGQNPASDAIPPNAVRRLSLPNLWNNFPSSSTQNVMASLAERRRSYSTDWRGPSSFVMADCGLYQVSTDRAKCHSCLVTIRGLTTNTCIWSLHGSKAPHCQFLRSYRGG
ncbi:hypothetical protein V1264_015896 [Littorina saxatilis]|uniref:Uncharacterized protein n=2 Tax=Littorina saxatilis TaxID=31220 RepID=A0AAN9BQZ6_9CAEN